MCVWWLVEGEDLLVVKLARCKPSGLKFTVSGQIAGKVKQLQRDVWLSPWHLSQDSASAPLTWRG